MAIRAYVFDAYGTLFDVYAAINRHRNAVGPDADRFSELWRAKQLEYSWTFTLMGRYESFWTLTERALDFCFARFPSVERSLKKTLLDAYLTLDVYPEARQVLESLKTAGFSTAILSNGSTEMLESAVSAAKLNAMLDHVLSVDAVRIFKPRIEVYDLAIKALSVKPNEIVFVSSNRWDVAGAANAGFKPLWVNRAGSPGEYPGLDPVSVIHDLKQMAAIKF